MPNNTMLSHVQGQLRLKRRGSGHAQVQRWKWKSAQVEIPMSKHLFLVTTFRVEDASLIGAPAVFNVATKHNQSTIGQPAMTGTEEIGLVQHTRPKRLFAILNSG